MNMINDNLWGYRAFFALAFLNLQLGKVKRKQQVCNSNIAATSVKF